MPPSASHARLPSFFLKALLPPFSSGASWFPLVFLVQIAFSKGRSAVITDVPQPPGLDWLFLFSLYLVSAILLDVHTWYRNTAGCSFSRSNPRFCYTAAGSYLSSLSPSFAVPNPFPKRCQCDPIDRAWILACLHSLRIFPPGFPWYPDQDRARVIFSIDLLSKWLPSSSCCFVSGLVLKFALSSPPFFVVSSFFITILRCFLHSEQMPVPLTDGSSSPLFAAIL